MRRYLILLSLFALSSPVQASSLPGADAQKWVLGSGSAPALGLEFPFQDRIRLGAGGAVPFYYGAQFGISRYYAHMQYLMLANDGFYISGLAGVFGELNLPGHTLSEEISPIGIEMGACFSYLFSEQLRLRLNLIPGFYLTLPPNGWTFLSPASGFEVAWRPWAPLEISLGFNGNGDILGLNGIF
ncbi:hypothetical protein COW36_08500 [bacterium (Candidatus Blackallbacteria) CG17_big_fil_post_rev_8_21_14_2_50_48_46]|uniref:Outer membrane protein beta-barrel domain-containing protein n=1 Tax=bacterium (Candidatus Blackallbacteria) CG17_big_fil_post_rev_8_21_14_2_50_48_46 TaxID=2014261 RepID=A0A2M7G652_9BACT|nr:MAG: hypothetical protein COW64_05800 [bacterium (Candidatus Blackallbacteria) CG18_big_fil_WC_8_21_14_2_50_49_26]PIW17527.1 MAG: hypothetical protein COW36_08500 [bacterium (Candidatus Blackallbacteria) CG17_big_fil_post_rev_8_21_14_2_50_48_46]PIW48381.1 MAG: hypothetical protein COW20_09850 [bacterium (Candidatus Blackallbacteria) CG13_big_fil_rev_8_21_14_2_50_49_14]